MSCKHPSWSPHCLGGWQCNKCDCIKTNPADADPKNKRFIKQFNQKDRSRK